MGMCVGPYVFVSAELSSCGAMRCVSIASLLSGTNTAHSWYVENQGPGQLYPEKKNWYLSLGSGR